MKLLKTVIYVFIAILFTHQTNAQNKNRLKSRVAFVSYSIQKNTRGESSLNFLDKKIIEGKFKKRLTKNIKSKIGHLKCTQLDQNLKPIKSFVIADPLNQLVEYPTNEKGNLSVKEVQLDETELHLKIPLENTTEFISVAVLGREKETAVVTKIK